MSNHMLIVEPDVESQRVCPPPPHKKLKYEGLTTQETINLNPKHGLQTIYEDDEEEGSPKRKKSDEEDEEEDDDSPKRKKSASARDSRDLYRDVQRKLNF